MIETGSTFNNNVGTVIYDKIEESAVKSIVKNDDLFLVTLKYETYSNDMFHKLCMRLLENGISLSTLINNSISNLNVSFTIKSSHLVKFQGLLEKDLKMFHSTFTNISRISLVGYGIANNSEIITKLLQILNLNKLEILSIQIDECKISIMTKEKVSNKILEQIHHELIA